MGGWGGIANTEAPEQQTGSIRLRSGRFPEEGWTRGATRGATKEAPGDHRTHLDVRVHFLDGLAPLTYLWTLHMMAK